MTRRQKREADRNFNSSARLIRRRDIARYSGSTTRLTVRKFQCDFMATGDAELCRSAVKVTLPCLVRKF